MKKGLVAMLVMLSMILTFMPPLQAQAASKLNKSKAVLEVDASLKLKISGSDSKATWETSNKKVVKVTKTGKVTGVAEGIATVTATVGKEKYTCKIAVIDSNESAGIGTRTNPYVLKDDPTFTVYTTDGNGSVSMKLEEVIDGAEANAIVASENMFNDKPDETNRWVLYHFKVNYLSGDAELSGYDLIDSSYLYNADSTVSIGSHFPATLDNDLTSVHSVSLYSGGLTDVWFGLLLDNDIEYITFKTIGYDNHYNSYEQWFTTNMK